MDDLDAEWRRKGATLSDTTARQEYGLTQDEIVRAIRAGKLHYQEGVDARQPVVCGSSGARWKRWSRESAGMTT